MFYDRTSLSSQAVENDCVSIVDVRKTNTQYVSAFILNLHFSIISLHLKCVFQAVEYCEPVVFFLSHPSYKFPVGRFIDLGRWYVFEPVFREMYSYKTRQWNARFIDFLMFCFRQLFSTYFARYFTTNAIICTVTVLARLMKNPREWLEKRFSWNTNNHYFNNRLRQPATPDRSFFVISERFKTDVHPRRFFFYFKLWFL